VTVARRWLTLLLSTVALSLAACGGGGGDSETGADGGTTAAGTTAATTASGGDEEEEGNATLGEIVFVTEGCGGCHTLAAAGVIGNIDEEGSVAPDLDEAKASYDEIVEVVTKGKGAMPSFQGDITPKDIRDVAAYVSSVAGK
jgi:mono/diheme cytochrome c family protein